MSGRTPRLANVGYDDSIDEDDVVFVDGEPIAIITDEDEDGEEEEE